MALTAKVITMDTEGARFKAFKVNNSHLKYDIFMGLSGKNLTREDRIAAGFVTPELATNGEVTNSRLGVALSHFCLWQEVLKTGSGLLIMEDDVMTHPEIWAQLESVPDRDQKDIVLFTCNMNAPMTLLSPEGVTCATLFDPKDPHPDWIKSTLVKTDPRHIRYCRLLRAFGLCCYYISPKGAKRLTESLFPLRAEGVFVPLISDLVMQCGLDRRLNALYDELDAFISIPFLAYTPHENEFAPK